MRCKRRQSGQPRRDVKLRRIATHADHHTHRSTSTHTLAVEAAPPAARHRPHLKSEAGQDALRHQQQLLQLSCPPRTPRPVLHCCAQHPRSGHSLGLTCSSPGNCVNCDCVRAWVKGPSVAIEAVATAARRVAQCPGRVCNGIAPAISPVRHNAKPIKNNNHDLCTRANVT